MPKSSKRFIISNSGLNAQGFRMLTEGAVLDDFEKNPLMLWNHQRPEGTDKNQILPIGHWEDIQVNGDELSAVPVFDDKDDFAMSIYNKVEAGHIRMCSAGAEPLETSEDETDLLPEQTRATVTKWRLKEASICDIGANPGSLSVALYDAKDSLIKLSDSQGKTIIPTIKMKKPLTTAKKAAAKKAADEAAKAEKIALAAKKKSIQLAEEAKTEETLAAGDPDDDEKLTADTDEDANLAEGDADPVTDEDKDELIANLQAQIAELKEQLGIATDQLKMADDAKQDAKVENLANQAVALRKITLAQKAQIIKLAKADFKGTVEYLNSIKASKTVKETLEENKANTKEGERLVKLSAMSWDELFKNAGDTSFLKLNAPDVYKAKFKEKFGKEPRN